MPKIPLYAYTPTASESPNVRANPSLLSAQYEAASRVGQAVAGVGERMFDFAAKKQEAVNYAKMADVDRQMREGFLLFEDELKRNGDEKTWDKAWQARAAQIEASVSKDVPPVLKEKLTAEVNAWKSMTTAQVRSLATQREIERGRAQVLDAADSDLKLGDVESYKAKISEGERLGLFAPDDAQKLIRSGEQKADWYAAFAAVNDDPAQALDMLGDKTEGGRNRHFTNLDEGQRYSLMQSARGALNSLRLDTQESLFNRRMAGEVIGDEELAGLVEKRLVRPEWAKRFAQEQRKSMGGGGGDATSFAEVLTAINDYDPVADTGRVEYAKLFANAQLLPDRMATDAVARLKDKADPKSVNNSAVAREAFGLVDDAFKAGLYGAFEFEDYQIGPDGRPSGKRVKQINQKVYAEAVKQKAQIQDGVSDFLKKKPNATRSEVVEEVTRLNQGFVDTKLREVIARDPQTLLIRNREEDKAREARLKAILEKFPE